MIGSEGIMEYGVIGRTVNVASRVERLTRTHGVDILVTEATRAALDGRFRLRPMPPVAVKGIADALPTFAVEGFDGGPTALRSPPRRAAARGAGAACGSLAADRPPG